MRGMGALVSFLFRKRKRWSRYSLKKTFHETRECIDAGVNVIPQNSPTCSPPPPKLPTHYYPVF